MRWKGNLEVTQNHDAALLSIDNLGESTNHGLGVAGKRIAVFVSPQSKRFYVISMHPLNENLM